MKNKFLLLLFLFFLSQPIMADNLNIQSSSITIDKKRKLTIFKEGVVATDAKKNILKSDHAEYDKDLKLLKSLGETTILTSEGFVLSGNNIIFDNKNNFLRSDEAVTIRDLENNNIYLEGFEYSTNNNFFRSTGKIKVVDEKNNVFNFSQIFIDEKKREIIGTDIKAFLNDKSFKINEKNKPRVFANTVKLGNQKSNFTKSIFTLCAYRKNDKCPPWTLQASEMSHDKKKKTVYYDNAVVKVFNVPIFYFPKMAHPDPTVNRRSGFLLPSFSDTKNLGFGFDIPYFWALNESKDFTLTPKLFASENPLFLGEYRQAFKKSNVVMDFGFTEGYKNTSQTKSAGSKSHFFSKFSKNFIGKNSSQNNFDITLQHVSNRKYLKLYRINTDIVDYETDTLENTLDFSHENEDLFFGFKTSAYKTLKDSYSDEYEYIIPDIILDKNLLTSNKYGVLDFQTNFKGHQYDTNNLTAFFVNDLDWKSKDYVSSSGLTSTFLGKIKNVNYEAKNISNFKDDPTSELFGGLGYLAKIDLFKKKENNWEHLLTPKAFLRYAPGHMRKESGNNKLNGMNIFNIDRLNSYNNFENGLSTSLGFDYSLEKASKIFNLSMGQVINESENKDLPSSSSLDQRFSDVIGSSSLKINDDLDLTYNFALDQSYKKLNYNEVGAKVENDSIKFNVSYLQEKEHIGNQEYIKSDIELINGKYGLFSAGTKRNLITNSAEYYNLSYEYINDCLRAGIVYRREFYNDSEIEPENSLMFKVTLTPFGDISSPSFSK